MISAQRCTRSKTLRSPYENRFSSARAAESGPKTMLLAPFAGGAPPRDISHRSIRVKTRAQRPWNARRNDHSDRNGTKPALLAEISGCRGCSDPADHAPRKQAVRRSHSPRYAARDRKRCTALIENRFSSARAAERVAKSVLWVLFGGHVLPGESMAQGPASGIDRSWQHLPPGRCPCRTHLREDATLGHFQCAARFQALAAECASARARYSCRVWTPPESPLGGPSKAPVKALGGPRKPPGRPLPLIRKGSCEGLRRTEKPLEPRFVRVKRLVLSGPMGLPDFPILSGPMGPFSLI